MGRTGKGDQSVSEQEGNVYLFLARPPFKYVSRWFFCYFFRVLHLGKKEISLSFSFFATCIAHSSYAAGAQAHEYSSSQERIAMNGTFFMYHSSVGEARRI